MVQSRGAKNGPVTPRKDDPIMLSGVGLSASHYRDRPVPQQQQQHGSACYGGRDGQMSISLGQTINNTIAPHDSTIAPAATVNPTTTTPPRKSPFVYNYWKDSHQLTDLCVFMPNGMLIELREQSVYTTLKDLKTYVWELAERYPLYSHLGDKDTYCFSTVSAGGSSGQVQQDDESKQLVDLQPLFGIFGFMKKKTVSVNSQLMSSISTLLGTTLSEKTLNNPEVNDFRSKMGRVEEEIASQRAAMTRKERIAYQYPVKLAPSVPEPIAQLETFCVVAISADIKVTVKVKSTASPEEVLKRIFEKKQFSVVKSRNESSSDYMLKVCGREEYIYGEHQINRFQYVQDCLMRDEPPAFLPRPIRLVEVFKNNNYEARDDFCFWPSPAPSPSGYGSSLSVASGSSSSSSNTIKSHSQHQTPSSSSHTLRKVKFINSWEIGAKLECLIQEIRELNCDSNRNTEVGVQLGLFHGGKSLCKTERTRLVPLSADGRAVWNQTIQFDIQVSNVPRMARLCLVVYENLRTAKGVGVRARRTKDGMINPIAWVNTMVYDYKSQLKTDPATLYTWTYAEDAQSDDILHPLGTVEPNPRRDECSSLLLTFGNYTQDNRIIVYPNEEELLAQASRKCTRNEHLNRESAEDPRSIMAIMSVYMYNDRLNDIHEQDRNAIWAKRRECMQQMPDGLPCLLYCVEWNNRDEVAEIVSLLQEWPKLPVERALELLDYAYADNNVRRYAVHCLSDIEDDELLLYLLQLVQALKHESYLNSDLVSFLLHRALHNQHIGHYIFWHLRSELAVPAVQVRFRLIMEAYLKSSSEHVPVLLRQMQCLRQLQVCSDTVKHGGKEKVRALLQEKLAERSVMEAMNDVISPLDPRYRCKSVRIERCKVMDSKMRPLWIVYDNSDRSGEDINMIFKNGDDLRQDMLTLQMLRIMDRIWKYDGMDLRLNPYSCISTDRRLGLIEVVLNAETIANIQKERGMFSATSPFKKGSLLAWLKEHNNTEELLAKAIQEFTLSCAGYCVATYVLGVADRHSDNIMVKRTGQLFHIDFGHILGHFKEKFGFRRERVPFVLTHDFVYVINNGRTDREAQEFRFFQQMCEDAFLSLRRHGCLILSLFWMMISTGLPELSSEKDLNYLRETLVLDKTEDEARSHFRQKFSEALANSWKTSLNWASHNFSKNNRQ
ncbi:phosphatidylinositol 4,5-bisphosphate 3-kinase catalytic subunit delta isoform-like [Anopheles albimanus]|uniref:phosphatidylinositol 3-kinase n=1 Tax=Anopheles albimanus TaxID=7167 RepID=A0A182FK58_ANOAL|nr:phosphatidylinositol 4,5-bisphosphate 3-kinase catalytic subunit delta isoform-like [Anopheles albimanus]XP_035787672.1 phosphatidylinositol 4,5-bisphosphate 3-kinase catalytic subunit delta isoform-like [Anopheles albimanus]XP_035787680.1 phosphatidylinositol 4,5-bisphosphate 3-kinase catalytic subunit delta isoform-like [Anopheles albimanus]XP_035787689.1 phosphatidylinositol 4,5-bisphosphate 3-kinase catalytic subunit delta isoform-like [Anopheles albimanus]